MQLERVEEGLLTIKKGATKKQSGAKCTLAVFVRFGLGTESLERRFDPPADDNKP